MTNRFFRDNGLSLVLLAVFLLTWVGQLLTGQHDHNHEREELGKPPLSVVQYIADGAFWQATGENWESEFLQMAMFVVLTKFLFQKGSPESRNPDDLAGDHLDEDPASKRDDPNAPWPVRLGGTVGWLYSHSLTICFALLFIASVSIHAAGGVRLYNEEQAAHGEQLISTLGFMLTSRFWFESFQNWQSEFLSLAAMVWLSVYLRERGSAESKRVAASNADHE
jgi:hypothetical protein